MPHKQPYVSTKFNLTAKIGDVVFDDVVAISATFGLNSIPSASLVVATGINARTGQPATIHENKDRLKPRDRAVVTLTMRDARGDTKKVEQGEFVIFDGFYVGIGYQRSFNSANYTLSLVHWLDDLNNSSMANGNWFPGAPFDLAQNAAYYALDPNPGAGVGQWSTVPTIDVKGKIINPQNLQDDLWGKIFKPVFESVASWPSPRYQGNSNNQDAKNDAALAALKRMPGEGKKYYKKLALDLEGLSSKDIAYSVRQAISKDALESFAYSTFWGKLVGDYAPQFFFAISPCVEYALPVPLYAGLSTPHTKIWADDYGYANFNANMSQLLESVDVFYPSGSATGWGIGGRTGKAQSLVNPMGYYPLQAKQDQRGMKLLKEPPGWMANTMPASTYSGRSTAVTAKAIGDTMSPQTGESKPPPDYLEPDKALEEVTKRQANGRVLDRFAEHWYKTELLSQRFGELSGKLRFDIAPGSIVEIEVPPRDLRRASTWKELLWSGRDPDALFATVTQVSYVINAERATAGTSFALAHIRTNEENKNETIVDCETCGNKKRPPLYKNEWKGAPLSEKAGGLLKFLFG